MKILLSVLLLTGLNYGYSEVFKQIDFSGGLHTSIPSLQIADNESQDCQNVFFDDGGIAKRRGFVKINNTAIGNGKDVNGLFVFEKSDGSSFCVSFSSTSGYYSSDDCATFTSFISTLTADSDVNCVPFQDRLYCTNGVETPFYFDGTNDIPNSNMPICRYLRVHQNRLWCGRTTTFPSRVYFSAVNNGTSWDTTLEWIDFNPQDGDILRGIGEPIYEILPVYKEYSIWRIEGQQSANYTPVLVHNSIGAKSHRDIKNFLLNNEKTIQIFSSRGIRGGEPGIYVYNGIVIAYLSDKINDEFENLDTFKNIERFKKWNTKSEWDTGTKEWTSSSIDVGYIQPSTWTATDTSVADFGAGTSVNVSTTNKYHLNSIVLSTSNAQGLYDNFSDGNYTSNPTWTYQGGNSNSFSVSGGALQYYPGATGSYTGYLYSSTSTLAIGKWSFYLNTNNGFCGTKFYFLSTGSNYSTTSGYMLYIYGIYYYFYKVNSGSEVLLSSYTKVGTTHSETISVVREETGYFQVYSDDILIMSATDTTYMTNGSYVIIFGYTEHPASVVKWDSINLPIQYYKPSGTFTSQILNTTFSTPTGGPFDVTDSTPAGTQIDYFVRESTATGGTWSSWVATSDTLRVPMSKQYQQYKADFYTSYSTQTPQINDVTLQATTTGYWESPEAFLSNSMSASWGLLQANETVSSDSSWTYQMKSSTYSGGTASASYTTQTNNTTISISTGAYIRVKAIDDIKSTTSTAKIDSITVNYNEGSSAKSSIAGIYKQRYYWFGQSQNGSYNDVGYVIDKNGAWTKLKNVNVRSLDLFKGYFHTGTSSTTSGGYIYKQDSGSNDDGQIIEAHWKSKDFNLGTDDILKVVDDIYLTYASGNATLSIDLYGDSTIADSWSVSLSTTTDFGIKKKSVFRSGGMGKKRASYFNIKFSESSIQPWHILGYRLKYTPIQDIMP